MTWLYFLVKNIGKIAVPLFFGRVEINGKEHIPEHYPFIIAPNHQNAFLDAILMGVYMKKPVHFLTRSDVFVPPFLGVLNLLNMMPVYRIRDGYENLNKNEEIFNRCKSILKGGNPVLIFPEGNMGQGHFLRPLTKGTSRLAFQTQAEMNGSLYVLPVGINYFHHYRPSFKCIINFGKPIHVRDFMDQYEHQRAKALIEFKDTLSDSLKQLLLLPDAEHYDQRRKGLNRSNEKFSFQSLKDQLYRDDFVIPRYHPAFNLLAEALTIVNPLAILGVRYLLNNVITDVQFTSSLKLTMGIVFSAIWWLIVFLVTFIFSNLAIAFLVTSLCILCLFFRSYLKKIAIPV